MVDRHERNCVTVSLPHYEAFDALLTIYVHDGGVGRRC